MAGRLLALAVAVAMVLAALALRSSRDGRGDGDGERVARGTPLRLVCADEVAEGCQALARQAQQVEVRVEPAGATAARLTAAPGTESLDLDAWLVPQPWPEIVASSRQRQGLLPLPASTTAPLARSPLVIAVWRERADVLAARCGGSVDWRCLGDAAPRRWAEIGGHEQWGPVKPGLADPRQTASGLLVLGQATAGYFRRTDLSSFDLDDDGYRSWLTGLERAVPALEPTTGWPLQRMLAFGPASLDAVGALEAQAGPTLERSARRGSIVIVYPRPLVAGEVVLTHLGGTAAGRRLLELWTGESGRDALAATGWRVEGRPLGRGLDPTVALPADAGLPPSGVLDALREVWKEISR